MRKPTLKEFARQLTKAQLKKASMNVEFMDDEKTKKIFKKVLRKEVETRQKRKIKRTGIVLIKIKRR